MQLSTILQVLAGAASFVQAIPVSSQQPKWLDILSQLDNFEVPEYSPPSPSANFKIHPQAISTGVPELPQWMTNGKSLLGSLEAPRYKQFKGQLSWGDDLKLPWGKKTAKNTNPYTESPDTGVLRTFDWTIARGNLAPDGVNRSMILVNGAFPGPTIEANWGDIISVRVTNNIFGPAEGTSVHWHGFLQTGTPWEDGVPGITQCPIAPGESFVYTFKAELYGTSWWHSHFSAQYSSGAFGAIVIHGPDQEDINNNYDADLGPVLLTDYYHDDYYTLVQGVTGTNPATGRPKSDNNLINGKGIFNCSAPGASNVTYGESCVENAGLTKFNFTQGQTYRLRLINAGSEGLQRFSIDNHDLRVIAYDFVTIQPYTTKVVTLGIGQRADILVTANQNAGSSYWMRSTMDQCSYTSQPNGLAIVYYNDADPDSVPTSQSDAPVINTCANDDLSTAVPYYPIAADAVPESVQDVNITFGKNATGHHVWYINNSTFRTDYNSPIFNAVYEGNNSNTFPSEWNAYNFGTSKSIRITINNPTPASHPMHLHGHNFHVLYASDTIVPNPVITNFVNPTRRDTQIVPPNGQIVIQFEADNPGVWPLHCHIAWHVSAGLYMNIIERPDEIPQMILPDSHTQLCQKWDAFTASNYVDQIDSGLEMTSRLRGRTLSTYAKRRNA